MSSWVKMGTKPRQFASELLDASRSAAGGYLEDRLDAALGPAGMTAADRRLAQELVFGVTRWQRSLDWIIDQRATKHPPAPRLRNLLRLGLYQLFWLDRIPDHAAIHESVELAKSLSPRHAGFVNALLRGCARDRDRIRVELEGLRRRQPPIGCSHPDWLCERWEDRWGRPDLLRLLDWNNSPPPVMARINRLRLTPAELQARWLAEGVDAIPRAWDWTGPDTVFELRSFPPLAALPSFQMGGFYLQDPSTLLAVRWLDPQPEDRVLDLCAAPGGKATCLAESIRPPGQLVAAEPDPARRSRLADNFARLGISSAIIADDQDPRLAQPASFDRVLADVPCSNTGVLRRRVELRWRLRPSHIPRMAGLQTSILERAAGLTRPGGILVYSTCSLEPEENQRVVQGFLDAHPDWILTDQRQLLPIKDGVDGAYVARLRRSTSGSA